MLIEARDQFLAIVGCLQPTAAHCLEQTARHPKQLLDDTDRGSILELGNCVRDCIERLRVIAVTQPLQQSALKSGSQLLHQGRIVHFVQFVFFLFLWRRPYGQVRCEQLELGERLDLACRTQLVHDWQQPYGRIRLAELQPTEIIRQQQDCSSNELKEVFAGFELLVENRLRQRLRFPSEHGGTVELDHLQGADNLVQMRNAETQVGIVRGVLGERLERDVCLFQALVDLGLDPAERIRIEFGSRAHLNLSWLPTGSGRPY